jgi:predicted membrane chloride channel (bestrophin family)
VVGSAGFVVIAVRHALVPARQPGLSRRRGWQRRLRLLLRVGAWVLAIGLSKLLVHHLGLEVITINPLFSALVASTVFLLGFLLNGVLSDFKESEKLPGEIATSLQTLQLEIAAIPLHHPGSDVAPHGRAVAELGRQILRWLHRGVSSEQLRLAYARCHALVAEASTLQRSSTLQGRLMGEMAALLRAIHRIDTIRETSFVPLVYWLALAGITLLCGGLVFAVSEQISEAFFFVCVIAFLLLFLLHLIDDLDNPFGIADADSCEDVSLALLDTVVAELEAATGGPAG